jgi:hypothetical protein
MTASVLFSNGKKLCNASEKKIFFYLMDWQTIPDPIKNYEIAGHPAVSG